MIILTKALRNASLSFLGAYVVPCFFPLTAGGDGEEGTSWPLVASHVLLR